MFRHMVVRLEDSPETEFAVGAALKFAKGYGSTITGLYVREPQSLRMSDAPMAALAANGVPYSTVDEEVYAATEGERQARTLNAFETAARQAGVPFHCDVRSGSAMTTFAESTGTADLVSMPRGEYDRGAIGSEVEVLVKQVPHPFLIASEPVEALRTLAVAYDGSAGAIRALAAAADIARNWRGEPLEIVVIEAVRTADEVGPHLKDAEDYLALYELSCRTRTLVGSPAEVIASFAASEKIDLLCMGAYGHSSLREFLLGSTTHDVVKRRRAPILLCH